MGGESFTPVPLKEVSIFDIWTGVAVGLRKDNITYILENVCWAIPDMNLKGLFIYYTVSRILTQSILIQVSKKQIKRVNVPAQLPVL